MTGRFILNYEPGWSVAQLEQIGTYRLFEHAVWDARSKADSAMRKGLVQLKWEIDNYYILETNDGRIVNGWCVGDVEGLPDPLLEKRYFVARGGVWEKLSVSYIHEEVTAELVVRPGGRTHTEKFTFNEFCNARGVNESGIT